MPLLLTSFARRVFCLLAIVLVVLGLSSFAANAGISSGLRDLLQGAMGTDLRVDSFVLDRSQATIGDTLRATVRVSNKGKAAATSTILTLWAAFGSPTSTANAYRLATVRLGTLQPATGLTSVNTFPVPNLGRLGAYQILATVESSSTEANKQNNTQARALLVVGPAFSDTDPTPVSDPDASAPPPPASTPVAGGGSSSPPASEPPASSGPSPPDPGSSPSSSSSPGSGSSSPSPSDPGPPAPAPPPSRVACDYYASPTGRGDGNSPASPFRIQTFWRVASPGKTLCLLDGTYMGTDSMISPSTQGAAAGLSGTRGNPITIRAVNDGQVLIDGQFALRTVHLSGNSWFIIEGINAKSSSRQVLQIAGNANNNIVRRSIFWDADATRNVETGEVAGASFNLLEDVAIFGTGRKSFLFYGDSYGNIIRRAWLRWEGSITLGPKYCASLVYNSSPESTNGNIWENVLCTWSGESMPQSYDATENGPIASPVQHFTNFNVQNRQTLWGRDAQGGGWCHNHKVFGSLGYVKATTVAPPSTLMVNNGTKDPNDTARLASCYTYKHLLVFWSPSHSSFRSSQGWNLGSAGHDNSATFNSSVAGRQGTIPSSWSPSNNVHASSLAGLTAAGANPWTGTTGANLCFRYVNGVKTHEPLWAWPMNDRIKEATASAGRYTGPCPGCIGGRFARTPTDVMAEIQALLGPIPSQCRSSR